MDSERLEDIVEDSDTSASKDPDFILVDEADLYESCPDEVNVSSEFLEELDEEEEEKANAKFVKTTRIFWGVLTAISAFLLCGLIYMKYIMWNPAEREFCQDNLFCGSSLAISSDELDDITATNSAYGTMQAAVQSFELPDPLGAGHIPPTAQEVEMIKKLLAEGFSITYYQEPSN